MYPFAVESYGHDIIAKQTYTSLFIAGLLQDLVGHLRQRPMALVESDDDDGDDGGGKLLVGNAFDDDDCVAKDTARTLQSLRRCREVQHGALWDGGARKPR